MTYDVKIFFKNGDIAEEQNLHVNIMNPYFSNSVLAYAKATYDEDPNIITHRYYGDLSLTQISLKLPIITNWLLTTSFVMMANQL